MPREPDGCRRTCGSDNGALGAGLLVGWTEHGDRPESKYVAGIRTGALIAPLAFRGPDSDELERAYTTISKTDIMKERGLFAAIFHNGMVDSRPLFEPVLSVVTPELLARIGEEYAKGRLLLVSATNLDVQQPVVWNMTATAAGGAGARAIPCVCVVLGATRR